jgi:hypothetical protein
MTILKASSSHRGVSWLGALAFTVTPSACSLPNRSSLAKVALRGEPLHILGPARPGRVSDLVPERPLPRLLGCSWCPPEGSGGHSGMASASFSASSLMSACRCASSSCSARASTAACSRLSRLLVPGVPAHAAEHHVGAFLVSPMTTISSGPGS